jgi:hypothetical protein
MKLAPIAIGLLATASLASPAFARGSLHLLHPATNRVVVPNPLRHDRELSLPARPRPDSLNSGQRSQPLPKSRWNVH